MGKDATETNVNVNPSNLDEYEIRILNSLSRRVKNSVGQYVTIDLEIESPNIFRVQRNVRDFDMAKIIDNETFLYAQTEYELELVKEGISGMTKPEDHVFFEIKKSSF